MDQCHTHRSADVTERHPKPRRRGRRRTWRANAGTLSTLRATLQRALRRSIRRFIPARYREPVRISVEKCINFGFRRYCPCCRARLRDFRPFGVIPRPGALCPVCGSLERHRLIYLYLRSRTNLFDGRPKRMLHVAPEAQLSRLFTNIPAIDYVSADLLLPNAMVRMDVGAIPFPDETFDVIYCSHVLEHVDDDRRAMHELHRVLRTDGWAILQVPITTHAVTHEDPSVTSPNERERLFGQHDHVRRYGLDYKDRLEEAGFKVTVDGFVRELNSRTVVRLGLEQSEDVYLCERRS
jgi:SAM-dependent methyltransferase